MTRLEFRNLKEGDICIIKRGRDEGRHVIVRYIEGEQIVIRAVDGKPLLKAGFQESPLRLTGFHELDIAK